MSKQDSQVTAYDNNLSASNPAPGFDEINIKAALHRAATLGSICLMQDVICRVTIFLLLASGVGLGRPSVAACLVLIFSAMWYISRERLQDTVAQIQIGFVVGAEKERNTLRTAKWDYFLGVLGSRATSRRDIAFFETALRLEPLAWGLVGAAINLLR